MPMKKCSWLPVVFVFLSSVLFAANQNDDLEKLSFLEGCWKGEMGGQMVYESWGNQDGNLMLGVSKTVSSNKIEGFEFLSLVIKDARIHYVPYVNGVNTVSFPLSFVTSTGAEFSNQEHDFPKSIEYKRNGATLSVTLSGEGQTLAYELNSIPCVE